MKNIKLIALIYLLTSFIFSNNYNIVGTVIDYETKKPIKNVNIFVKDTNFGKTTTDEGYFQLILTSHCHIDINVKSLKISTSKLKLNAVL